KKRLWRGVISIFVVGQLAALVSARLGAEWPSHVPRALFVFVVVWHYCALGFGLFVLLPVGVVRASKRMLRLARRKEPPGNETAKLPVSENLVTRREFLGAAVAFAPPLFTIGLTGVALSQLSSFRTRRFTLSIPTLPRALDGITIAHVTDMHVGRLT